MIEQQRQSLPDSSAGQQPLAADRLTVLLVNYNGKRYLGPCIDSIYKFSPPGTQVILEDNASTDGSAEYVAQKYPSVQIVRSVSNLGFAGGNNLASQSSRGKFLLLLNTDTELLEPIGPVLDWLESHDAYGALTINMVDSQRIPRACTGRFPTPLRLALLRRMLIAPETYGCIGAFDVDWVQGSFLLIRASLWHSLNGLDDRYFMYAEDVDLSKRIHDAGFKCAYVSGASYLHWGGFDSSRFPDQVRGLDRYVAKHMRGFEGSACRAVLLGGCVARAILYNVKSMIWRRQQDRVSAEGSWRAFLALREKSHRT